MINMEAGKKSKISIIMPAYNAEEYIAEAIESVIGQSYYNWELAIVDDGSTDASGRIADEYAGKESRIKVIHTPNCGVSHARNVGIDCTDGEWVAFLDSDDIMSGDALELLIEDAADYDVVIGDFNLYPRSMDKKGLKSAVYSGNEAVRMGFPELFVHGAFSTVWGKIFKRSALGIRFDETFFTSEDVLFFSKLLGSLSGIKTISPEIYFYRQHSGSITHNKLSYGYGPAGVGQILDNYLAAFPDSPEIENILYAYYIHHITAYVRELVGSDAIDEEQKTALTEVVLHEKFFKKIPLKKYPVPGKEMRLWMVMKSGDIGLIMNEINRGV